MVDIKIVERETDNINLVVKKRVDRDFEHENNFIVEIKNLLIDSETIKVVEKNNLDNDHQQNSVYILKIVVFVNNIVLTILDGIENKKVIFEMF